MGGDSGSERVEGALQARRGAHEYTVFTVMVGGGAHRRRGMEEGKKEAAGRYGAHSRARGLSVGLRIRRREARVVRAVAAYLALRGLCFCWACVFSRLIWCGDGL